MDEKIGLGLGLYQSCRNMGSVGRVSVFGCGGVGGVGGECVGRLDQGLEGCWRSGCVSCESGFFV